MIAASAAHAAGNYPESTRLCKQVLESEPSNPQAMLLLGVIEAKVGDPFRANNLLDQVLANDPSSFFAYFWKSIVLRRLGRTSEAIEAAAQAVELNPDDAQASAQLGICYLELRMLPEAETCLTTAVELAPQMLQIQYSLSQCLQLQGRVDKALEVFRFALASTPESVDVLLNLARSLLSQGCAPLAEECARKAVALDRRSSAAILFLARILVEENLPEEAEKCLESILSRGVVDAQTLVTHAMALQGLGKFGEAFDAFRKSIAKEPRQGYAYTGLANSRRMGDHDRSLLSDMRKLTSDSSMPREQVAYIWYALGKGHEDLGEYPEAMEAYDEANRIEYDLKFRSRRFDRAQYAAPFDRVIHQFTHKFIVDNQQVGIPSELPVFVVGMMRSGTTLVEQILSSHPEIGAAGEQPFWLDNWRSAMTEAQDEVDPDGIDLIATRYLAMLFGRQPGKSRIVDKMPANYPGLGIIHLALPQAKIIHIRRNPVDTCISIYTTANRSHPEYAHDRDNIATAYRQYLRVMDHWRSALPAGTMLEIDYEDLVADSEPVTRRMIEFCGLQWDDACLRPEQNARVVITPSVWQVRQPIYRSSVERWRRFEPWLGAFEDLAPHGMGRDNVKN
jgi:tetratricopeptide (TPR) repeat protein